MASLYEAIEADKFINIPIAKTHGLSTLTLGMKNLMGIMGSSRGRIHQRIDGSLGGSRHGRQTHIDYP